MNGADALGPTGDTRKSFAVRSHVARSEKNVGFRRNSWPMLTRLPSFYSCQIEQLIAVSRHRGAVPPPGGQHAASAAGAPPLKSVARRWSWRPVVRDVAINTHSARTGLFFVEFSPCEHRLSTIRHDTQRSHCRRGLIAVRRNRPSGDQSVALMLRSATAGSLSSPRLPASGKEPLLKVKRMCSRLETRREIPRPAPNVNRVAPLPRDRSSGLGRPWPNPAGFVRAATARRRSGKAPHRAARIRDASRKSSLPVEPGELEIGVGGAVDQDVVGGGREESAVAK